MEDSATSDVTDQEFGDSIFEDLMRNDESFGEAVFNSELREPMEESEEIDEEGSPTHVRTYAFTYVRKLTPLLTLFWLS